MKRGRVFVAAHHVLSLTVLTLALAGERRLVRADVKIDDLKLLTTTFAALDVPFIPPATTRPPHGPFFYLGCPDMLVDGAVCGRSLEDEYSFVDLRYSYDSYYHTSSASTRLEASQLVNDEIAFRIIQQHVDHDTNHDAIADGNVQADLRGEVRLGMSVDAPAYLSIEYDIQDSIPGQAFNFEDIANDQLKHPFSLSVVGFQDFVYQQFDLSGSGSQQFGKLIFPNPYWESDVDVWVTSHITREYGAGMPVNFANGTMVVESDIDLRREATVTLAVQELPAPPPPRRLAIFDFEATVTNVSDLDNVLFSSVKVGDTLTGSFQYDLELRDEYPSIEGFGRYDADLRPENSVQITNGELESTSYRGLYAGVVDSESFDSMGVYAASFSNYRAQFTEIGIYLEDQEGTAFTGDDLPTSFDLDSFETKRISFSTTDQSGIYSDVSVTANLTFISLREIIENPFDASDWDGDGSVSDKDLQVWKSAYGLTEEADADGDGRTSGHDFLIWQRDVGPRSLYATPEPPTWVMILAGYAGVMCASLKRQYGLGHQNSL